MSDRKALIEEKKAKLAAMREEKLSRTKKLGGAAGTPTSTEGGTPTAPISVATSGGAAAAGDANLRADTEAFLQSLGIAPAEAAAADGGAGDATARLDPHSVAIDRMKSPKRQKKTALQVSKVTQTTIAPVEKNIYSKETQTVEEAKDNSMLAYDDMTMNGEARENGDYNAAAAANAMVTSQMFASKSGAANAAGMQQSQLLQNVDEEMNFTELELEIQRIQKNALTEQEKANLMSQDEFAHFFERCSTMLERAVCQNVKDPDPCIDYSGGADDEDDDEYEEGGVGEGGGSRRSGRKRAPVKVQRRFQHDRWTRGRAINCLHWSPIFPELLLSLYVQREQPAFSSSSAASAGVGCNAAAVSAVTGAGGGGVGSGTAGLAGGMGGGGVGDPEGVVALWNIKFKRDQPEYVLHSQAAVFNACLAAFHPNLVLGGCYSGKLVLWDIRSNKRSPVQRTPLNLAAHTQPVCYMRVLGSQNAHNLVSVSAEGRMCVWSLDMLSQPVETLDFLQTRQNRAVTPTSVDFLANDVNNFLIGCEDGLIYSGTRHGTKSGLHEQQFEGHLGPALAVNAHKVAGGGQADFSHLFLSSSIDWTVRLWSSREPAGQACLHKFEDSGDYVYDVAWSPTHPAMFASVNGLGVLDLWHLNRETEVPLCRTQITGSAATALNKCSWHESGAHLAVGDDSGCVTILDVNEQLAQPKSDEWSQMSSCLAEMSASTADNAAAR